MTASPAASPAARGDVATRRCRDERGEGLPPRRFQRVALAALLVFCLTVPSNWTQDVPARSGKRHVGLEHSWLYPAIDTAPRRR